MPTDSSPERTSSGSDPRRQRNQQIPSTSTGTIIVNSQVDSLTRRMLWINWVVLSAVSMLASAVTQAQSTVPFVPGDFQVPATLETKEFRLRVLTVNDVIKDYDAVMSSVEHLKNIWPGSGWPIGLTLEQNLVDLGWHQKEFQRRRSFAYTVVTPDESRVIGCVYINPTRKQGFDAVVFLWARQSELPGGLETRLHAAVKGWVAKEWPFKKVAFPGRDVGWEAWRAIPERAEILNAT